MPYNPFLNMSNFNKYNYGDKIRGIYGDHETYIDPYLTGYHFVFFTKLPQALQTQGVGSFLTCNAQSVTVPDISVAPISFNGVNGFQWSVPGTVTYNHTVSIKFIEFAGIPITMIMGNWVNIYRNLIYGIADPTTTNAYTQSSYKGKMLYATTLPDAKTVQYAAAFTGVYPTNVPTSGFNSDRANQQKFEPNITFQFDMMYTGESLKNNIQSLIDCTRESSVAHSDGMYLEAISVNGEC